jgi:hypothetical protein
VTFVSNGAGYVTGDQIRVLGSLLGGTNTTNDLVITVTNAETGSHDYPVFGTGTVFEFINDSSTRTSRNTSSTSLSNQAKNIVLKDFTVEVNNDNIRVFNITNVRDSEFNNIKADYFNDYFNEEKEEHEQESIKVSLPDEYIPFSSIDLDNPDHLVPYNYLIFDRKINRDLILKHRLGFCLEGKYRNRIIIPSYDKNGMLNYFVARTWIDKYKPSYLNPKIDKSKFIYNEGFINWDAPVYLVEGGFDELSFPVNTIPLLGKVIGEKLFYVLKDKKPEIIIILDPDAINDAIKLYNQLQSIYLNCEERVKIKTMEGKYDIDEIKRNFDVEGVKKVIQSARYLNDLDYLLYSKKK